MIIVAPTTLTLALVLAVPLPPGEAATSPMAEVPMAEVPCGWPDPVAAAVLDKARKLMPAALARQLARHERALLEGARRAGREHARHLQGPGQQDGAAALLAESLSRITALVDGQRPMREVVREMGVAAHLVADLSNPFRSVPADRDAAAYAERFGRYVARHRDDLRVVFEGYAHDLLERGEVAAFGAALAERSRSYVDDLVGGFRRHDSGQDPNALDQRSVAFGVASLTYSRSVTDTARAWLHAWRQAHGDLSGLPYPLEKASR